MSYGGNGKVTNLPAPKIPKGTVNGKPSNAEPDFRKMTTAEKVAYHRQRLRSLE